jgi:voltage-dependent potassium channel beta subunit
VTFDNQLQVDLALECMQAAHDAGCNFFDNAEVYAGGKSEQIMGDALAKLAWPRWSYVLTTKVFWGIHGAREGNNINVQNTLNRKYLMQAIDPSLERLGQDFVDVLYCHRADPNTPVEETVWAMSDIVSSGKALYWGTSEWAADEIRGAIEIAERHHLHKPVTEQPQYNLFERERVEVEYKPVFDDFGYGATIWSPLASGLLTGKYRDGVPADSRGALPGYGWLAKEVTDPDRIGKVEQLRPIADGLGCSLAQLALAWCATNPNVSTVLTGASKPSQVAENFGAMDVIPRLTPDVRARITAAVS